LVILNVRKKMEQKSIYDYYAFGHNYRIIRFNWGTLEAIDGVQKLERFLRELDGLELPVSRSIAKKLEPKIEELRQLESGSNVTSELALEIEKIINMVDPALDAELEQKKVLYVTPKRFDVEKLLSDPKHLLANGSWDVLTDTAREDYSNACLCIAFSLGTASAFHIMRTAEEMVKVLYFHYVKTNRMEKPMWGPMVIKLRSKRKPKPSPELLDHLDVIRTNFRNPTQHPEKFYSIDEAQDLLFATIVAINQICADIQNT
jgi:hypothetical protein